MSTKFRTALNAAAVALVMVLTLPISAHIGSVDSEFKYTPINGPSTGITFNKYLVMDKGLSVPNSDFTFTIDNKLNNETVARPQTSTTMAVKAGPMTDEDGNGAPTVTGTKVSGTSFMFTSDTDETPVYETVQTGDNITLDSGKQYAKQTVTVDLSGVTFSAPGIYRYIISETTPTPPVAGIRYTTDSLALDVFVIDKQDADHTLEFLTTTTGEGDDAVTKYVYVLQKLIKGSGDEYGPAEDDLYSSPKNVLKNETMGTSQNYDGLSVEQKATGIVNRYNTTDLFIGKKVDGNQGSRDKYFEYTVTITGLTEGQKLPVDVASGGKREPTQTADTKYSATTMKAANSRTTIGPADSTGTLNNIKFYLQNDQFIKISGLPKGATYSVVEDAEGYLSTEADAYTTVTDDGSYTGFTITDLTFDADPGATAAGTVGDSPIYTGYVNKRQGTVPTGVTMSYAPHAIIGSAALAGIVLLAVRRRKKEEE